MARGSKQERKKRGRIIIILGEMFVHISVIELNAIANNFTNVHTS